jgi:hypothetical protein
MAIIKSDELLAKTYKAVWDNLNTLPTQPLLAGQTMYRAISPSSRYTLLEKPSKGVHLSKGALDKLITPPPPIELNARYSGSSTGASNPSSSANATAISGAGGIYFALQTQALINEMRHYRKRPADKVFNGRAVLKVVLMGPILVADLSPHTSGASTFLAKIGKLIGVDVEKKIMDPIDCSVARGIGLAVANSGKYAGLLTRTARESERSKDERGDNVVLYGSRKRPVWELRVESVEFYDQYSKEVELVPVDWY